MTVRVTDDVAGVAAELLLGATGNVVLAGGSTPKQAYALVHERGRDWAQTRLWLGDERHVPLDDERSNGRMARDQLGEDAPIEFVDTTLELDAAAADYEQRLRAALTGRAGVDLVLLGLGPDSHTASLFPGKPALDETERFVVGVPEAGMEPQVPRVTMTFPVFAAARQVVFLVAGADKADAMVRAFGDPPDVSAPAARVLPQAGELVVIADPAAMSKMPS
jgi:6-phosphogluconolactonase